MGKTGTTLSVSEETRDLIRDQLGPEETYDDRLRKWANAARKEDDDGA